MLLLFIDALSQAVLSQMRPARRSSLLAPAGSQSTVCLSRRIGHRHHEMGRIQVVNMGRLSWGSFEPSQGNFTFDSFDGTLDKLHADGIHVILGIPTSLRASLQEGGSACGGASS